MSVNWGRGSTRQSRTIRAIVLHRDPTCYIRGPRCTGVATEDDHVVPRSQGGSDHLDNRAGACHTCHFEKTQREAAAGRRRARRQPERHPGLL